MQRSDILLLTVEARRVLLFGQEQLGQLVGVSRRTVQRWDSGRGGPNAEELSRLAIAVHPRDQALAGNLAAAAGTTLERLGLVQPPPPPPAVAPRLVDTVVCAAAEALNVPPPAARPVLLAAFGRAHEVGLSVEDVVKALGEPSKASKGRAGR